MIHRFIICCVLAMPVAACDYMQPAFQGTSESAAVSDTAEPSTKSSKPPAGDARKSKGRTAASAVANGEQPATGSPDDSPPIALVPGASATLDSVGPLVVGERFFTVIFERERHGGAEHVRRIQIRDERGVAHYEERFDPPMQGSEPEWTVTVSAHALRGERGQGMVLYYQQMPSAPLSGTSVRVFGLQGSRLAPLAPHMSVRGRFGELQESRDANVLFLGPGELFDVEVWQGHFGISVPLRVRLDNCTSGCIRPAIRRGDIVPGLSILPVAVPPRSVAGTSSVQLFDAPEGNAITRVQVSRRSEVVILDVAADVFNETLNGVEYIRARREWLRVRIDGREGWIHGDESFTAIGLPAG